MSRILQDHARFRHIVRGRLRGNLRRYIAQGELLGKQGKNVVSIPLPHIDIPRFRLADKQRGGVGQGEGEPGDPVQGKGRPEPGQAGPAGNTPGDHPLEVEVSLDELADILGEELELPHIERKGQSSLKQQRDRYVGLRNTGPESLRHFRRTFRQALRRQIALGTYNAAKPVIIPTREDMRYKSWKEEEEPLTNAVIIYMMDVSGSMGQEQKDIVRIESFWIDTWLSRHYQGVQTRFIIHDASAREVDRETFFHTRESGGTMISSAYRLAAKLLEESFPPEQWNVYLFHFSDGDNWSVDDTMACVSLLRDRLLPAANLFGYGQVESPYGSGQFIKDLREHFASDPALVTSDIRDRGAIVSSIQEFLGKGR